MTKKYTLPPLPYSFNALEPVLSEEILKLHHDKHHAGYVNAANAALEKLDKAQKEGLTGVDIKAITRDLSFNASGHILHSMFWENMKPGGGGKPGDKLADRIITDFGSFDSFKQQLSTISKTVEGSGWGVFAYDQLLDQLIILGVEKHQNLGFPGAIPVLVLDVWEHAYYLQYKNDRAAFVDNWWNIVNWEDVDRRVSKLKL
jgi:Fe-Mn family superoxide dismutase